MKKIMVAATMAVIMVITLLTFGAFADDALTQLKADFAAAPTNGVETVIELSGDISNFGTDDIITVAEGQNIVFDMNGHSITVTNDFVGRPFVNYGTLTITGNGKIDVSNSTSYGYGQVNNFGHLVIENGTFLAVEGPNASAIFIREGSSAEFKGGTYSGASTLINNAATAYTVISGGTYINNRYPAIENNGDMVITGGNFTNTSCSSCNGGSNYGYTIRNGVSSSTATLLVEEAYPGSITVTGVQGGIAAIDGFMTIKSGTFQTVPCEVHTTGNTAFYALYVAGESGKVESSIYGGTFTSSSKVAAYVGNNILVDGGNRLPAVLNIYGGTFNGGGNGDAVKVDHELGGLDITGGTFSSNVSAYVSKAASANDDGTVVTANGAEGAVASIVRGGQTLYYTSLNDAVEEARDGETVSLLDNVTITEALEVGTSISIVGNGYTVTADKCVGFYIKADLDSFSVSGLTLKGVLAEGGKAGEGSTGSFMGIGTYNGCYGVADLSLNNVTIDGFSYGLYFGKNPAGGTGPFNENPVCVTADGLTVQNCYIKGAYFEKLTDSSFTNCKFISNGADESKVESAFTSWMCGVDINLKNGSYQNISFTGCEFTGNGANSGTALLIKARDDGNYGSGTVLSGVEVTGCSFEGNNGSSPVMLGEPGKGNHSPVNVVIQSDVAYSNNVAQGASYTVSFDSKGAGDFDKRLVAAGESIVLPSPSKSGYIFMGWKCSDGGSYNAGESVVVNSDLTFTAAWANMPDVGPSEPDEPDVSVFPFADVSTGDWFYNAVYYVWENGLMNGTDTYKFSPNSPLTRAMVWAVLARIDGVKIEGDSWVTDAQKWAVESGVSDGTNPTGYITREQLVTMLWRYKGSPAVEYSITAPDAASISDWAVDAMKWAASIGLIEGDETGALNPASNSTRAHAATFMMRYCENAGLVK